MDEEKLTILVQEPECWYNLQHEILIKIC